VSGAAHNRGRSKQDYATPWEFVRAVEALIGAKFGWDLAASAENTKAPKFITEAENSLGREWACYLQDEWGWLNPPFANIAPWAAKCAAESAKGAHIAFLVPASVGSNWFAEHVDMKALVRPIRPRLSFDGKNPYPKDLILCLYGERPGFHPWRWRP
jgi:phage N-6-adenine-methyltransferase